MSKNGPRVIYPPKKKRTKSTTNIQIPAIFETFHTKTQCIIYYLVAKTQYIYYLALVANE